MKDRENRIRLWFAMWLQQKDLGMDEIFAEDVTYVESWGPEYHGREAVKHWFQEWNTRGRVAEWNILQFFHRGNQTVVEWTFRDEMEDGHSDQFDGMSRVVWTEDGRIRFLKEFGCNVHHYDPYRNGDAPEFSQDPVPWF